MKILIIGDRHVGGYGLTAGQISFIGHFIRQINETGRAVSVEAYVQSTLSAVQATLAHLPLERYDLILVQAGQGCLDHPAGLGALFAPDNDTLPDLSGDLILPDCLQVTKKVRSDGILDHVVKIGQFMLLKGLTALGKLPRQRIVQRELTNVLTVLKPHRHKVILLSPFPHREPVHQWLRQQGRSLFMRSEVRQAFSVFDSDAVVKPRDEYFLTNDSGHLNAIGHELVGRALFDFYLAAPTIVAIHSIRRS
ncbi:SGNH/GDSL hydrolase family protein [Spirosoma agri]|uniref:SGNH/GDSL hydrolase family protein n=1 Tax=Spirosoma agri TaxID=1987381 RepID=A0A6M0IGJ1_9BACT|nr:SGNH/GDSL hydrolase family protein [Spirosoma agri]NEU67308.1 SGNH/GDSL hydrolase family protein [Spirosoma agri]